MVGPILGLKSLATPLELQAQRRLALAGAEAVMRPGGERICSL